MPPLLYSLMPWILQALLCSSHIPLMSSYNVPYDTFSAYVIHHKFLVLQLSGLEDGHGVKKKEEIPSPTILV